LSLEETPTAHTAAQWEVRVITWSPAGRPAALAPADLQQDRPPADERPPRGRARRLAGAEERALSVAASHTALHTTLRVNKNGGALGQRKLPRPGARRNAPRHYSPPYKPPHKIRGGRGARQRQHTSLPAAALGAWRVPISHTRPALRHSRLPYGIRRCHVMSCPHRSTATRARAPRHRMGLASDLILTAFYAPMVRMAAYTQSFM
jgi:hypothetical protein